MNKTLTISSSLLLSLVLGAIVPIGSTVYWVSNLATRVQHTEESVSNFKETDTSILQERLVTVEERLQFNSDNIDDVWDSLEKLDVEAKDMEDKLAGWMEREIAKVYEIINTGNPLGQ